MNAFKVVRVLSPSTGYSFEYHETQGNHPNDYILVSAVAHGDARVTYLVGEWAHTHDWLGSQGYYLTAFAKQCVAVRFLHAMQLEDTSVVFEVETDIEVSLPRYGIVDCLFRISKVKPSVYRWPLLTVMTKALRPTRCVWSKLVYPPLGIERTEWP